MPTADLVLSRFPRHLDADGDGKLIGEVVTSLATPHEAELTQVGRVRRSHRLGEVDQLVDLHHLADLHGFGDSIVDALLRRVRDADPAPLYDSWLRVTSRLLADAIVELREESATVAGLLAAAATYLGADLVELDHDDDGYWHLARCTDLLSANDAEMLLALEENPPRVEDLGPSPRHHADRFSVLRHGFDPVPTTVVVRGLQDRTLRPMVVNLDDGFGVATMISIPDGGTLRFERDGRVELDGSSVARRSFTFRGAVYADETHAHPRDFVYDDATVIEDPQHPRPETRREGVYTVTQPPEDAFDPNPSFPHAEPLLPAITLGRSATRFTVFVGAGLFGSESDDPPTITEAAPHPIAGVFDDTVFEPDPTGEPSFEIGFEWDEREAYAARVWLPRELGDLDHDDEQPLREVVRALLDSHRAAGVHLYVEYADPRWTLGTGVVRDLDSEDALGIAVAGTETWSDDTEQPADT